MTMKRNLFTIAGVLALVFALAGCDNSTTPGDPALAGNIHIATTSGGTTAATTATTGTNLYAVYSGTETVSYQWNKGGSAISGATSATYTPSEAGSYTVTVSASGYTGKTSAAVTVTGSALSTLAGSIHIATTSGGTTAATTATTRTLLYAVWTAETGDPATVSYQWNKDGTAVPSATRATYTPTEAGSYTVTVSASGYTGKTSAAVAVLSTLAGSIHIATTSGGTTAATTATTETPLHAVWTARTGDPAAVTYQWNKDGTAVPNATNATYTPSAEGSYTVTVSAEGYEPKSSAAVTVTSWYALGDTGPGGGKIFYVSEEGFTVYTSADDTTGTLCHYLEAAPRYVTAAYAWASGTYTTTDISGTATAIGTGRKNTALILATDSTAPAALFCKNATYGDKTDWFLPSKDELAKLYENRDSVGASSNTSSYWSSSQDSNNSALAWSFYYRQSINVSKSTSNYSVWAVRAF